MFFFIEIAITNVHNVVLFLFLMGIVVWIDIGDLSLFAGHPDGSVQGGVQRHVLELNESQCILVVEP